jgi:hypothetical protein
MRHKYLLLLIPAAILFSCKKEKGATDPPSPPPLPAVLLKDLVISRLPSPFYHFEYNNAGKVIFVSYASDLTRYDVIYDGDRISEMRNNIIINKDRLQYFYDNAGRVNVVRYADSTGLVYTRINLTYDGSKLIKLEREKKLGADFIVDKIVTMSYHPDGNLLDFTIHRPAIAIVGQDEYTTVDRYEQYDNKIGAEGFSLLHDEFFDHFVFLPAVQMQKNNPGKVTHTGDGVNYTVDYTYTYNDRGAPLTKSGDFVYTSGPDTGQRFQLSSTYTYYP